MRVGLYVDGGCSGNDQPNINLRRMVAVVTDNFGQMVADLEAPGGSNNIAELWAVSLALKWCVENKIRSVHIWTDSRNNFAWVFGKKLGKHLNSRLQVEMLKEGITEARRSVAIEMTWVPREKNLAGHYIEAKYGGVPLTECVSSIEQCMGGRPMRWVLRQTADSDLRLAGHGW